MASYAEEARQPLCTNAFLAGYDWEGQSFKSRPGAPERRVRAHSDGSQRIDADLLLEQVELPELHERQRHLRV